MCSPVVFWYSFPDLHKQRLQVAVNSADEIIQFIVCIVNWKWMRKNHIQRKVKQLHIRQIFVCETHIDYFIVTLHLWISRYKFTENQKSPCRVSSMVAWHRETPKPGRSTASRIWNGQYSAGEVGRNLQQFTRKPHLILTKMFLQQTPLLQHLGEITEGHLLKSVHYGEVLPVSKIMFLKSFICITYKQQPW